MTVLRWVLSLAVGGFLIMFGAMKFMGAAFIFPYIEYKAAAAGLPLADLFYPVGNYAVGALELVAGVLVILPMTRSLGAPLAVVPLLGAVVFHLSPYLGIITPVDYADPKPAEALAAGGGFVRENFSAETAPMLFITASVLLAAAIVNLLIRARD
ncbi:MAG: hypothetical protein ACE5FO_11920 [Parvularculaceae bacterium]